MDLNHFKKTFDPEFSYICALILVLSGFVIGILSGFCLGRALECHQTRGTLISQESGGPQQSAGININAKLFRILDL